MESDQPDKNGMVAGRMTAMLMAAVLIGIAYNRASPLGVRRTVSGPIRATPVIASRDDGMIYQNETTAIRLEQGNPPAASAPLDLPVVTGNTPVLGWREVKTLLAQNQIILVDARKAVHFELEHIPGAISLPENSTPEVLGAFVAKYPRNTALVIYCGSTSCPMAHQLATILITRFGYSNVREMPGGFAEFRQLEPQPPAGGAK